MTIATGLLVGCFGMAAAQGLQIPAGNAGVVGFAPTEPPVNIADIPLHPAEASGQVARLHGVNAAGYPAHFNLSNEARAARLAAGIPAASGPMTYHGGPVMLPYVAVYEIFWVPNQLQDGSTAPALTQLYSTLQILLGAWYPGHEPFGVTTEYYQVVNNQGTFINNSGGLGGYYVDTSPYTARDCTDTATPNNCVSDGAVQAEIAKVMAINGWTGGLNKIFILHMGPGMGSCFSAGSCFGPGGFCAYHTYFMQGGTPVIYGNDPNVQNQNGCIGSGYTAPNNDWGDIGANTQSHEIAEAATDPLLNAWYAGSVSGENGDLCAGAPVSNTWQYTSSGLTGNHYWNGWIFELQPTWSNHTNSCASSGY